MDIVDRLFELVDEKYKEQKDFANAIDVPAPRVSEWRKRKSASYSKKDILPKIADVLGTTTEYLLTGEGPKTRVALSGTAQPDLVLKYNQLTPEGQKEVLASIEFKQAQESAIAARGGRVVKKPSPVSAETLDELSQATAKEAEKENNQF